MSTADDAKRAAFTSTALPLMDNLYNTALYLSRDPDQAADLLQDTLLRAYRSWHQFLPGTNCKAWLLTILYNAFRNRYRAERSTPVTVEFDEALYASDAEIALSSRSGDPADVLAARVLDGDIEAALGNLPEEYRTAVVLVDLQELTYEEAATVVGAPVGTIRSRLSRGRHMLQRALREYAQERGLLRRG